MKKCKNCNYYKTGECILYVVCSLLPITGHVISEPTIDTPGCPDWTEIPRFVKKIGTIGRRNCMGKAHAWLKREGR